MCILYIHVYSYIYILCLARINHYRPHLLPRPPAAAALISAQLPLKAHLTCSDASIVGNDCPINQRPTHL